MAKKDLISVIIPAYNVERYFARCLDSVLNQTYKNIEVIIVDDGSIDRTGILADQYAEQDERIKVIHQANGGNAAARNTGLKNMTGAWMAFIDSDDYVSENYLETLYNIAIKNHADISACDYQIYEWEHPQATSGPNRTKTVDTAEALKMLFYQKSVGPGPHCKLCKTELYKGITFPVGKICEDLATTYKIFARAKRVAINGQKMYFYLTNPSGTMQKQMRNFKPERAVALDFCEEAVAFVDKNFPELHTAAVNRLFTEAIYIFTDLPRTKEYADIMQRVWGIIKQYRNDVISDAESKDNIRKYAKVSKAGKSALRATLHTKNKIGNYLGAKQRKKTAVAAK